jgi:lipid-A-disaccharide synthase-like uncharacterized protein
MKEWFQSPAYWYVLGYAGQAVFGSRFIVQWWVSERNHRVVIPQAFWYLSLLGGITLLAYALLQREPVFAVGQLAGVLIYARNLHLARREKAR